MEGGNFQEAHKLQTSFEMILSFPLPLTLSKSVIEENKNRAQALLEELGNFSFDGQTHLDINYHYNTLLASKEQHPRLVTLFHTNLLKFIEEKVQCFMDESFNGDAETELDRLHDFTEKLHDDLRKSVNAEVERCRNQIRINSKNKQDSLSRALIS